MYNCTLHVFRDLGDQLAGRPGVPIRTSTFASGARQQIVPPASQPSAEQLIYYIYTYIYIIIFLHASMWLMYGVASPTTP